MTHFNQLLFSDFISMILLVGFTGIMASTLRSYPHKILLCIYAIIQAVIISIDISHIANLMR